MKKLCKEKNRFPYSVIGLHFFLILFSLLSTSCKGRIDDLSNIEIDHFNYIGGTVNTGENLAQALQSKGLKSTAVYPVVNALNSTYDLRRCQPADSFYVKIDSLEVIHSLTYYPVREKVKNYVVSLDTTGFYISKVDTLKTETVLRKTEGVITSSLYEAMFEQGEGPHLTVRFAEIFQWDLDFFIDPRQGDRFSLIYEQYMVDGKFVQYGNILAAEYQGNSYNKRAYRYQNKEGGVGYYDSEGKSFKKAFLKSPLNYTRISSYFSTGRNHPILKIVRPHNGVDFAAPTGTPVVASSDGVVSHAAWKGGHPTVNGMTGGYGKTVMIRHTNGYETLYGHLSRYGEGIKKGVRVSQNQVIGYVGSTGLSTGPHLHYTVYLNGKAIDPLRMNNVPSPPVPKNEEGDFKGLTRYYDDLMSKGSDAIRNIVMR
ncbi:MAG: M23 family metallopeptidase [Candidatus Cloacimonadia bacterium]